MSDVSTLAIFVDDAEGELGIGLAISDPSIVELETGELVVGCKFTVEQAARVWNELGKCIAQITR